MEYLGWSDRNFIAVALASGDSVNAKWELFPFTDSDSEIKGRTFLEVCSKEYPHTLKGTVTLEEFSIPKEGFAFNTYPVHDTLGKAGNAASQILSLIQDVATVARQQEELKQQKEENKILDELLK